jgi:hypothetical protein
MSDAPSFTGEVRMLIDGELVDGLAIEALRAVDDAVAFPPRANAVHGRDGDERPGFAWQIDGLHMMLGRLGLRGAEAQPEDECRAKVQAKSVSRHVRSLPARSRARCCDRVDRGVRLLP